MYPLIDDVCKKMTKFIHQEIEKQHPDGVDAKEVIETQFDIVAKCLLRKKIIF